MRLTLSTSTARQQTRAAALRTTFTISCISQRSCPRMSPIKCSFPWGRSPLFRLTHGSLSSYESNLTATRSIGSSVFAGFGFVFNAGGTGDYSRNRAGSPYWPFPMLKYKRIFQIKYTAYGSNAIKQHSETVMV